MIQNAAFTICTKSYLGLAKILEDSILKYNASVNFYIFIADEMDTDIKVPNNAIVIRSLKILSDEKWEELSFKYDVTEFCTCLKPFIFDWLFKNKPYEKIVYLDPDLFFFDSIDIIYNKMTNSLITLTPHFVSFPQTSISKVFEDEVRYTGLYNLGFLGLSRSAKTSSMLNWWATHLIEKCFVEPTMFQFTDQKWMDFMSVYFDSDELNIVKDLGWNIAPWNYFERKVVKEANSLKIVFRNDEGKRFNIVFAHFSGFDYKALLDGNIIQKNAHKKHQGLFDDVDGLFIAYIDSLKSNKELFMNYIKQGYTYSYYTNGKKIENMHRRLYSSIIINNYEEIINPFDSSGPFYKQLVKRKMFSASIGNGNSVNYDSSVITHRLLKINKFMCFVYNILGYEKYKILLRIFFRLSKYENNIFLYNKHYTSWL